MNDGLVQLWAEWRYDYVSSASRDESDAHQLLEQAATRSEVDNEATLKGAGAREDAPGNVNVGGQEIGEKSTKDAISVEDRQCVFCRIAESGPPSAQNGVVWRGEYCLAVLNLYPYASGHLLIVPLRHESDLSNLTDKESHELWETTRKALTALKLGFQPEGFNLGANLGRTAGAGIPDHLHIHVVPRWGGDTNFMTTTAGVRVIPQSMSDSWKVINEDWVSEE